MKPAHAHNLEQPPPEPARIFVLRAWPEREIGEICKEMALTPANARVMLYRASVRPHECLDRDRFGKLSAQRAR